MLPNVHGVTSNSVRERETANLPVHSRPAAIQPAAKRAEPKIFVPDRAPDDPGPEPGEAEDDAQTPLARFRGTLKQHTT